MLLDLILFVKLMANHLEVLRDRLQLRISEIVKALTAIHIGSEQDRLEEINGPQKVLHIRVS